MSHWKAWEMAQFYVYLLKWGEINKCDFNYDSVESIYTIVCNNGQKKYYGYKTAVVTWDIYQFITVGIPVGIIYSLFALGYHWQKQIPPDTSRCPYQSSTLAKAARYLQTRASLLSLLRVAESRRGTCALSNRIFKSAHLYFLLDKVPVAIAIYNIISWKKLNIWLIQWPRMQ